MMYLQTATPSRSRFFRVKPGRRGALKRISRVGAHHALRPDSVAYEARRSVRRHRFHISLNGMSLRQQMNIIALIDTRPELPGETIGTVISTHGTIAAAFKANEAFQSRMRARGVKSHIRTKIVTLKVQLGDGEHVRVVHLFLEGEKSGQGKCQ